MSTPNKSLVAMASEMALIEQALITASGELSPELEDLLKCNDLELPEKVDGYAYRYSRLSMLEAWYKDKADEFLKMAKGYTKAADKLKDNAKTAMELLGTDELKGVDYRIKVSRSKPIVSVIDEKQIPGAYLITETITKVDKKKIAEMLTLGLSIPGAELNGSVSLRVYTNGDK